MYPLDGAHLIFNLLFAYLLKLFLPDFAAAIGGEGERKLRYALLRLMVRLLSGKIWC